MLSWSLGLAAGLWPRAEGPIVALADLLLALPIVLLAMLVLLLAGPSASAVTATLVALSWPAFARIVCAQVLAVRHAPHVEAARALGATEWHVARRHILPATYTLMPAKFVLTVRLALFTEATLAFLGLGDPATKSWGAMLGWAFNDPLLFTRGAWLWCVLPPALSISLAVLATSWLASALDDTTRAWRIGCDVRAIRTERWWHDATTGFEPPGRLQRPVEQPEIVDEIVAPRLAANLHRLDARAQVGHEIFGTYRSI
ncbi:MAG: ABC transporter permease [Chloroflexi bacterium]|nr:ABC transporter permease [Chloroflexota bacterium]